jgi:hypothetical protein
MIWLTWRQFRTPALVAVGVLVLFAILLGVTGPSVLHLYDTTVVHCATHNNCPSATQTFLRTDLSLQNWVGLFLIGAVPGLIGVFWGAPLVAREIEAGTLRLAWTQSVSRTRWLAIKIGVVGLTAMVVTGLLSLMITWWFSPIDRLNMTLYSTFDRRDIVPAAYAAFAVAFGVTAGVLIRRTIPAMATTVVGFVATRVIVSNWVRPHLIAPLRRVFALNAASMGFGSTNGGPFVLQPNPPDIPNAWISSTEIVDKAGHALPAQFVATECPSLGRSVPVPQGGPSPGLGTSTRIHVSAGAQSVFRDCVAKVGRTYHEVVTYQPASRYWTLQWYEFAVYLALAALLVGLCFWWVRRRLS